MNNIQTSTYLSNGCLVISLCLVDLSNQVLSLFIQQLNCKEHSKIILCLEENRMVSSLDIEHLERFIRVLELMGKSIIVCGLKPDHVKVLVEFVESFNFTIKNNVNDAINSF